MPIYEVKTPIGIVRKSTRSVGAVCAVIRFRRPDRSLTVWLHSTKERAEKNLIARAVFAKNKNWTCEHSITSELTRIFE